MFKTIRRFLGIEKFEIPRDPFEFSCLRPILESHLRGGWSMGKTPDNPAIVVQLNGKMIPSFLKQQLEEMAEYHGFKVEIHCLSTTANTPIGERMSGERVLGGGVPKLSRPSVVTSPGRNVRGSTSTAKMGER